MSTKISVQKVTAVLKKAGQELDSNTRFSSGLTVKGIYQDYPLIEVDYVSGERHNNTESWTELKVVKLVQAGNALIAAGLKVWMKMRLTNDNRSHEQFTLYLVKDEDALTRHHLDNKLPWDEIAYVESFKDDIAKERERHAADLARKAAEQTERERRQAERIAQAKFLNPVINWDMKYMPGLWVTHVVLMDGRVAVLTVMFRMTEESDWHARGDDARYQALKVEILAAYKSQYHHDEWDNTRSTLTGGKGDTLEDVIWFWIANP